MINKAWISLQSILLSLFLVLPCLVVNADVVPLRLYGLNYNTRQGPDWNPNRCKSLDQISADLLILSKLTSRLRILSLGDCNQANSVLSAIDTYNLDLSLWLGLWTSNVTSVFEDEMQLLRTMLSNGQLSERILGITVGSEAIYRKELTAAQSIENMNQVKSLLAEYDKTSIPVAIVDVDDIYEANPELFAASDVAYLNSFPFWENVPIDNAVDFLVNTKLADVWNLANMNGKDLIVGETGWASSGENPEASDATGTNQAKYLQDFFCLYDVEQKHKYFYFTGIDTSWRIEQEQDVTTVEGHFGLFYSNLTLKEHFQDFTFTCPGTGDSVQYKIVVDDSGPVIPVPTGSSVPVSSPPIAISPSTTPTSSCASNPECAVAGLEGDCCPGTDGNFLLCCTTSTDGSETTTTSPLDAPSMMPIMVDPTEKPEIISPVKDEKSDAPVMDDKSDSPTTISSDLPSSIPSINPNGSNYPSLVPVSTDNPTDRMAFNPSSPISASPDASSIISAATTTTLNIGHCSPVLTNVAIAGAIIKLVSLLI